jgi:hypothetical protein
MLVVTLGEQSGETVYLDIHHLEWRQESGKPQWAVSALLGDGWYEGEVLVEVGEKSEVTFADEWLGRPQIGDLFRRLGRERLREALVTAVRTVSANGTWPAVAA